MSGHALDTIAPAVVGERLAGARKAKGLTQQAVADALGFARTTLVAIEKGERRVRARELIRIADLYGRAVGDFVQPEPTVRDDSFVVQFRSARKPSDEPMDRDREQDIQRFRQLCEQYLELEDITDGALIRRDPAMYDTEGTDAEGAAEEVASAERNRLGLGDGPIGRLWELLGAALSLRVFAFPFADRRAAGLFAFTERLGGCIAVNLNHPEERRRWSTVHELGHFLTRHRFRAEIQVILSSHRRLPESERFAEAFARHFLMPGSGIVRRYQSLSRARGSSFSAADLLTLSQLYGVSIQAMSLRLEELRLLPAGTWTGLKNAGFKVGAARKLLDLPPLEGECRRLPFRYELLAARAFMAGSISEERLMRFLELDRLAARARVDDLVGTSFDEDGAVWQLALDLDTILVGT